MDPLTIGLSLIKFAPDLVKWFTGSDKDAEVAAKAVAIAQEITGAKTPEAAIEKLEADPAAVLAYKTAVLANSLELEKLATQNAANINTTMQVEAGAEHWPSYSWRPYNGFLYGTTIFCTYFLLPLLKVPVPTIPVEVWLGWSAILGVASWFRGRAQADPAVITPQMTQKG